MTHLILLDNRYHADLLTNDRLGDLQWNWLDEALKEGKARGANVTIIGAGLQMIPQHYEILESFMWPNKKRLFDLF